MPPPTFKPGSASHDFIRLVERTTNALVTKEDGVLEEVKKALIRVHQQYDQVHEEAEAKQARLNRLRDAIRTADQEHMDMNKGESADKIYETEDVLNKQLIELTGYDAKRGKQVDEKGGLIKEAETTRKVYEHMLKRTQREQAIVKQKLFKLEEHLSRKNRELQQKQTEREEARCAKIQMDKTLKSYDQEAKTELYVRDSALEAIQGELEKRKEATADRAKLDSWLQGVALAAANDAFNASAGRLRKLYAIEKLSGNCLQKTTFEQVQRSQTTEDGFQAIRDITGLSDVMDIVHKFLNREVEHESLKNSVKEAEGNLDLLRQRHEKLKQEMEGLPVDHIKSRSPMALRKKLEQAEQKLNEAIEEQEACSVQLQKATLQSEHMKRWAARMGGVLAKVEEPAKVDVPADLPVFFRKFGFAVKKFIKRVSDQIKAGKINRKILRDFEKDENKEQKDLLSDKTFLYSGNKRVPSPDKEGQVFPTPRCGRWSRRPPTDEPCRGAGQVQKRFLHVCGRKNQNPRRQAAEDARQVAW